jgi:hypothetical protein
LRRSRFSRCGAFEPGRSVEPNATEGGGETGRRFPSKCAKFGFGTYKARDNSEDGVTGNVFRYLEKHGLVGEFVDLIAGERIATNPRVVYWSFCQTTRKPWQRRLDAATTFGEQIGRRSEPDIIVDDDNLLAVVEKKWLSGNTTKPSNPNNPKHYMTGGDGWFRKVFKPTADFKPVAVNAKLYELMRFWLFGSWVAKQAGQRFLLINVVRGVKEADIEGRFGAHIQSGPERRFRRVTWEGLYAGLVQPRAGCSDADRLALYLREKTIGYHRVNGGGIAKLGRAFALPTLVEAADR